MRVIAFAVAALNGAIAAAGAINKRSSWKASCNADNCARAVTGTFQGLQATHIADCSSAFACTVTPAASTVTITTTVTTSTDGPSNAGGAGPSSAPAAVTAVTSCPSSAPAYASACSGFQRYSSACSCAGVTHTTVTAAALTAVTTTSTVFVAPPPASTSVVSSTATSSSSMPTYTSDPVCPALAIIENGDGQCQCSYLIQCGRLNCSNPVLAIPGSTSIEACKDVCDSQLDCAGFYLDTQTNQGCYVCNTASAVVIDGNYELGRRQSGTCRNSQCT